MRDRWLAAALLLGLVLRMVGLGHGLPFVYNPDEVNIMSRALSVARDLNPHYFLYPSFFFYFVFAVMGGVYVVGRLLGHYGSVGEFEARFFENPTEFYLAGRAIGLVSALLSIVLTYHLARRHFGKVTARAAAFFLAVAYVHVRDAHYLKHDVPSGLLVILALVAFDRAMERPSLRSYVASGLAMGLAFATHYYTIFLAPAFVLCHAVGSGLRRLGHLVVAAVASATIFFLLSPFVVLDLPVALEHVRANRQIVIDRSLDAGSVVFPSLPALVRFLAEQGIGYVLLGLVVVGSLLVARRSKRLFVLWGAFPLLFLCLISYTFFAGRYLNPIAPQMAVAAAVTLGAAHRRWGRRVSIPLVIVACLQPLYYDIQVDRLFSGDDTRTLARAWILGHLADGTALLTQSYSVPLPQSMDSLREGLIANRALGELERRGKYGHVADVARRSRPSYRLFFLGRGEEKNRIYLSYEELVHNRLEPLHSLGVDWVVLKYPPGKWPAPFRALRRQVLQNGVKRAELSPFRLPAAGLHPYMDNEDWPARAALRAKGPLIEIFSLDRAGQP